jgi:hypothetical protein
MSTVQYTRNSYDMKTLTHDLVPAIHMVDYDTDNLSGIVSIGRHNFTLSILERERHENPKSSCV